MKCLNFLYLVLFCHCLTQPVLAQTSNLSFVTSYDVGVILDMGSSLGKMANSCIWMGISDFYAEHSHYKTRLVLHPRDSMGEPLQALSSAIDLLQNNEVQAVIGPQTSNEAEFLVDLGVKVEVPIISFSATSPFVSHAKTPYFVRVATNDNSQAKAIAALVQAFRWSEVVLVYEDTIYGNGVIPHLVSALNEIRARVPYRSVISPSASDDKIVIELYRLMTMSTRVFVVHMSCSLAFRVFSKAKELGMMSEGYAWIVTDGITNMLSSMNSSAIESMQGMLGIRPYLSPSEKVDNFTAKWRSEFPNVNQSGKIDDLNRYCLWAYDAVWLLSRAAEKVAIAASGNNKLNSSRKSTNLMSIPVSQTGLQLLKEILKSKFDGISGNIELTNGEIQPVAFQIVNVVGNGIEKIGFWTPQNGISQKLNVYSNKKATSYSPTSLKPHIWPGASMATPRGWIMPVSGKKLRVGVPVSKGFKELVNMERDPSTNATSVSGFCIDVFKAAVETLPYAVPYEFIPFEGSDGRMAGNFDDLLYQVYLQKYDAVVGDITITASRFSYVDFTLPFTEAGVAMAVPTQSRRSHNMWIFLEPLTIDLWLVIAAFFVWTGLVVWVIEHRSNHDFQSLSPRKVGRIFWDSISTLVFAQGEKLMSSLSKFVVIVWLFVALILTSSYTASLSSLLTARQLQQLPKGGNIGYYSRPLVTNSLNNWNFGDSGLKSFDSFEEYIDAFKKGSQKGGVSAIIDEITYIKLFIAKYHAHFTMINATYYNNNGFGFAFSKGSPLAVDFSMAIAKLREDGKLELIEKDWFKYHTNNVNEESPTETNVLNFYSFRGLFIIMGMTSALAFIISYVFMKDKPTSTEEAKVVHSVLEHLPSDNTSLTFVNSDCSIEQPTTKEEDDVPFSGDKNNAKQLA